MSIMASQQVMNTYSGVLRWSAVAWAELGRWAAPVQVEDVDPGERGAGVVAVEQGVSGWGQVLDGHLGLLCTDAVILFSNCPSHGNLPAC